MFENISRIYSAFPAMLENKIHAERIEIKKLRNYFLKVSRETTAALSAARTEMNNNKMQSFAQRERK